MTENEWFKLQCKKKGYDLEIKSMTHQEWLISQLKKNPTEVQLYNFNFMLEVLEKAQIDANRKAMFKLLGFKKL